VVDVFPNLKSVQCALPLLLVIGNLIRQPNPNHCEKPVCRPSKVFYSTYLRKFAIGRTPRSSCPSGKRTITQEKAESPRGSGLPKGLPEWPPRQWRDAAPLPLIHKHLKLNSRACLKYEFLQPMPEKQSNTKNRRRVATRMQKHVKQCTRNARQMLKQAAEVRKTERQVTFLRTPATLVSNAGPYTGSRRLNHWHERTSIRLTDQGPHRRKTLRKYSLICTV
jgi:hypothetical protein